jgi:hypothetical protein
VDRLSKQIALGRILANVLRAHVVGQLVVFGRVEDFDIQVKIEVAKPQRTIEAIDSV